MQLNFLRQLEPSCTLYIVHVCDGRTRRQLGVTSASSVLTPLIELVVSDEQLQVRVQVQVHRVRVKSTIWHFIQLAVELTRSVVSSIGREPWTRTLECRVPVERNRRELCTSRLSNIR